MSQRAHHHLLLATSSVGPHLHNMLERAGPIRLSRSWKHTSLPEALCRSVAGQQLSVAAARTIWGRVLEHAGDRALVEFLRRCRPETLRRCGLSAAKTKAMRAIAKAVTSGQLDEQRMHAMAADERSAHLTKIWGVGPWTADMINIFYYGDRDIWPEGDLAARKTLSGLIQTHHTTVDVAQRCAPYRSYLALQMWRHLDANPD